MKLFKYLSLFVALLFLSCAEEELFNDLIDERLEITNDQVNIKIRDEFDLQANFFNNAGAKDESTTIDWSSKDNAIIQILNNAKFKAVGVGKTSIVATVNVNGKKIQDSLSVNVEGFEPSFEFVEGIGMKIKVLTTIDLMGDFFDFTGLENKEADLTWTVSDDEIAEIVNENQLKTKNVGEFTLTLTTDNNGEEYKKDFDFVVEGFEPTIEITGDLSQIKLATTNQTFSLGYNFTNELGMLENTDVIWENSDSQVATISNEGEVKTLKIGETTIKISANINGEEITDSFELVVTEEPKLQITNPTEEKLTIKVGEESSVLSVVFTDENANQLSEGEFVLTWMVEDSSIAEITNENTVKALTLGNTTITAQVNYKGETYTDSFEVETIIDPVFEITNPSENSIELINGETLDLNVSLKGFKGESVSTNDFDIIWEVVNSAIATVDGDDVLTTNASGTTTVKAEIEYEGVMLSDEFTLEVKSNPNRTGTFSGFNGYSTTGDFTITQIGSDIELKTAANFRASGGITVPIYLTNNINSIANAVKVADNVVRKSGELTFNVNDVTVADYKYLIQWCSAISETVGVAELK